MQAASALLANAIAATGGDGALAPDPAGGSDAFTSALAALMGALGQAQLAARGTSAQPPVAAASANTVAAAFHPAGAVGADAATTSVATAPLGGPASGGVADALQVLDAVVAHVEAAQKTPQSSDDSGSAGSTTSSAPATAATSSAATAPLGAPASGILCDALQALDAVVANLEAPQTTAQSTDVSGGAASTTSSPPAAAANDGVGVAARAELADDPLLVLLEGASDQAATEATPPGREAAATAGSPSGGATSPAPSETGLDPQLIRFVARASLAPGSDAPAADRPPAAPASAAPPSPSTSTDGLADPQIAATGENDTPPTPANPVAAGLLLFSPAPAQPAGQPQPLAAARPNAAKTATSTTSPGPATTKPASPPDVGRAGLAAVDAARDDPEADTSIAADDAGQAPGDGQAGGDPSAGSPPTAFQLAGAPAPTAASVAAPPAAAALAQAHGAEIAAQLAAQIASRAGAVKSSFDFSLEPQGLGRVDVNLKIDPQGGLSAVLSFDNPTVAAEARSRSGDLQQALQQAGFDVSQSGLSFTSGGGQGHGAAFQAAGQPPYAAPATSLAEAAPPELAAISATLAARAEAGGLDITI